MDQKLKPGGGGKQLHTWLGCQTEESAAGLVPLLRGVGLETRLNTEKN